MAVIQISRIQHRRGQTKQTGFPQLASGEFGWSIDTQELYIGNGAVSEGAPAVGNTRLLTENDTNFFLAAATYTYGDSFPGLVADAVTRSIQSKLDDALNLRDFGAKGDGVTDDTAAITRALNYTSSTYKVIEFPEGTYLISDTIYIPPFTEIRGVGLKTIIQNASTATATIFQTVDGYGNQLPQITSGNEITPQYVKIDGITFYSTLASTSSLLSLDCLQDSIIRNCVFVGDTSILTTSTQAGGIELRGQASPTCDNILIKDCVFQNLGRAISSNYDMQNLKITENKFINLNSGVVFANSLTNVIPQRTGPTLVTITDNSFENINRYGVYVGPNVTGKSIVKSSNNTFVNVGSGNNNTQGDLTQVTSVINFSSFGNLSTEDSFSRLDAINTDNISIYSSVRPVVSGPMVYNSKVSKVINLTGIGLASVFIWPKSLYTVTSITSPGQTITLNYTLNKPTGGIVRRGVVEVAVNGSSNTITDNFSYTGTSDGSCTFYLDASRSDVINVKVNNQGTAGVIVCSASVRQ